MSINDTSSQYAETSLAKQNWYIYNPSDKPAHRKHVDMLRAGLSELGQKVTRFRAADLVYVQTTGAKVPFVLAAAKLLRKRTVLYYHEPCTLREKLEKRDRLGYSLAVKAVQLAEFMFASTVLVSSPTVRDKLRSVHPVLTRLQHKRIIIAPLMIADEFSSDRSVAKTTRPTLLFLGRLLPDQRQFRLFAQLSAKLQDIDFVVLTRNKIPKVDGAKLIVIHEAGFFSEDQRREALMSADLVWTPYDVRYNQSGVIPDALSAGCGVVVSDLELDKFLLDAPVSHILPVNRPVDVEALGVFVRDMWQRRDWRRDWARRYYLEVHGASGQLRVVSEILQPVSTDAS